MDKRTRIILITLFAVIVAALVGYFTLSKKTRSVEAPQRDEVLSEDRKILATEVGPSQYQIYAALVRLAQSGDPAALEQALKRIDSALPWVRAGAGQALCYFDSPEANQAIEKLINDKEDTVRLKVYEGLASSTKHSPTRLAMLKSAQTKESRGEFEKLLISSALVRMNPLPSQSAGLVKEILSKLSGLTAAQQVQIILGLTSALPLDPDVGNYLSNVIRTTSPPEIMTVAINTLSVSFPDRMRDSLLKYSQSKDERVRVAAIQGIPFACPRGAIETLGEIVKTDQSDLVVKTGLQILSLFPKPAVGKILTELKNHYKNPDTLKVLNDAIRSWESNKSNDPCRQFDKQ